MHISRQSHQSCSKMQQQMLWWAYQRLEGRDVATVNSGGRDVTTVNSGGRDVTTVNSGGRSRTLPKVK